MVEKISFRIRDFNYNLSFPILFFIPSLIGIFYLNGVEFKGGTLYFSLITLAAILLVVLFFFVKEFDRKLNLYMPFSPTETRFSAMLLLGVFSVVGVFLLLNVFGGGALSAFLSVFKPFTISAASGVSVQSFAALSAATSEGWTVFIVVLTAAVQEEFLLGFVAVNAGLLFSHLVLNRFFKVDNNFLEILIGVFLLPMVGFMAIHVFNGTYVNEPSLFLFAGLFRLLMNFMIYFMKFGLGFAVGFHGAVNAFSLGGSFLVGLFSLAGVWVLVVLVFAVITVLSNWGRFLEVLRGVPDNVGFDYT